MNEQTNISRQDVKNIANSLSIITTEAHIEEIVKRYPEAQDQDQSATWDLVVEQLLEEVCIVE
jgi:Ca2+-binding EF-hand superfamily protein